MTSKAKDGRGALALALIFGINPDLEQDLKDFEEACGPIKFEDEDKQEKPSDGNEQGV